MTEHEHDMMVDLLVGFINDPPDNEFQRGVLVGVLIIGKEVLGINNPIWEGAYEFSAGAPRKKSKTSTRRTKVSKQVRSGRQ
jgi:hypothetical protein